MELPQQKTLLFVITMFSFLRRRCCDSLRNFGRRSFATQTRPDLVLPWLMLSSPNNPESRYFFDIVGGQTLKLNREIHLPQISGNFCIGSSDGFLFSIPTCNSPEKIHAINPLNLKESLSIPSNTTLQAGRQAGPYTELHQPQNWKIPAETVILDHNYYHLYKSKVILSPSKDMLVLARFSCILDFACLDGSVPCSWTPISNNSGDLGLLYSLEDLIFHKGFLYVVDCSGNLLLFDADDLEDVPFLSFASKSKLQRGRDQFIGTSLVESPDGDDLFFVHRIYCNNAYRSVQLEVLKLCSDFTWKKVESIGDLVMFVGHGRNICLRARDFPNIRPNSIYFTDYFSGLNYPLDPLFIGDTGVFNLKDRSIQFFKLFDGTQKFNWPPPIWFAPAAK